MRQNFALMALATASLSTLSCAGVARYTRTDKVQFVLHLWINDDPALSKEDALKGCEEWLPKGVRCALTDSMADADVRVKADMSVCVPDKEGKRILAWAYKGGDVTFMMQCFKQSDGTYDMHEFRAVMTHEIGHELGVWEHIPEDCDDKDAKPITHLATGKKICGKAVMNPYYHKEIWFVTDLDSMAFDMRDLEYSVIVPTTSSAPTVQPRKTADGPDCSYYAK